MKTLTFALLFVDAMSAALPLSFEVVLSLCFVSGLILFAISDYGQTRRRFKFEPTTATLPAGSTALRLAA